MAIFDHAHPKVIEATFSFPRFVSACKKISLFRLFEIQSSLEPREQTGPPIFDHADPKHFQSPFNLRDFVPACKKSVNPICSFLRYNQF